VKRKYLQDIIAKHVPKSVIHNTEGNIKENSKRKILWSMLVGIAIINLKELEREVDFALKVVHRNII
tara:strand:- start:1725 stop:1925 length:201 start_codon:yes stop_codon:yes gene_type:complete